MEPDALPNLGIALTLGALIGLERQFAAAHEPASEPAGAGPAAGPVDEREHRAALAAAEASASAAAPGGRAGPGGSADAAGGATDGPPPRAERQQPAGVRTYALIALAGGLAALLGQSQPWTFPAALVVLGAMLTLSHAGALKRGEDPGLTSEVAALLVFLLGAVAGRGETTLAAACAVAVASMLALKRTLHGLARRIREEDVRATLTFAVITSVVLPLLPPDPIELGALLAGPEAGEVRALDAGPLVEGAGVAPVATGMPGVPGPPGAPAAGAPPAGATSTTPEPDAPPPWWHELSLAPRTVWWMVILISGISFTGYVLSQTIGLHRGLLVTAAVGGLASSTATSLSYAQRSRERPDLAPVLLMGILVANAIMPLRLLLVLTFLAPPLARVVALPLLAVVVVGGLSVGALALWRREGQAAVPVSFKNPFEIGPALKFGAVFGLVLVTAQVAQALFGQAGLYVVAVVTGLTDVDAISLAMANLVGARRQLPEVAATTVALAVLSNTVVKAALVVALGDRALRWLALGAFGSMLAALGLGLWLARST